MTDIDGFETMLADGRDSALLRYTLGALHLKKGDPEQAVPHLRKALEFEPGYSAAWKALGKALTETGADTAAIDAYQRGIAAAEQAGDKQSVREMQVFLKRLQK